MSPDFSRFTIDPSSALPLYAQAEEAIRGLLKQEQYRAGTLIPKETDLALRLGISRHTVRAAMDRLVREGLLVRKKGVGTSVNTSLIQTKLTEWTSFTHEMGQKGIELELLSKSSGQAPAPEAVALALGIATGTPVIWLTRLKGQDGQPVVVFRSWFHPRLAIGADEAFEGPLYSLLETKYHGIPVISDEQIGAKLPEAQDRELLGIEPGCPVLYRHRLVRDRAERPLEYCLAHYRADRFEYSIRITRDGQGRI